MTSRYSDSTWVPSLGARLYSDHSRSRSRLNAAWPSTSSAAKRLVRGPVKGIHPPVIAKSSTPSPNRSRTVSSTPPFERRGHDEGRRHVAADDFEHLADEAVRRPIRHGDAAAGRRRAPVRRHLLGTRREPLPRSGLRPRRSSRRQGNCSASPSSKRSARPSARARSRACSIRFAAISTPVTAAPAAPPVGASLEVMEADTRRVRGAHPFVFTHLETERVSTRWSNYCRRNIARSNRDGVTSEGHTCLQCGRDLVVL